MLSRLADTIFSPFGLYCAEYTVPLCELEEIVDFLRYGGKYFGPANVCTHLILRSCNKDDACACSETST